jgi:hypothetical protein
MVQVVMHILASRSLAGSSRFGCATSSLLLLLLPHGNHTCAPAAAADQLCQQTFEPSSTAHEIHVLLESQS